MGLALIAETATGFDNIDLPYCRRHGIAVANVKGYSTDCVAQLTAALALSLIMHLGEYSAYVRDGSYSSSGLFNLLTPPFHELRGKTWGIVGGGNIGTRVAQIAAALGCRVLVYQRHPHPDFPTVSLDELCAGSDILSLHVPLNEGTKELINAAFLEKMKPGALLINVARGGVTDEAAVAQAVLSGKLGGFAADVYTVEPFPAGHPFDAIRSLPNVILTPHMAWGGVETRQRLLDEIAENIRVFLGGGIRNRVDL